MATMNQDQGAILSAGGYDQPKDAPPAYGDHAANQPEKVAPEYGYPQPYAPQSNAGYPQINTGYAANNVIIEQPRVFGQTDVQPGEILLVNDYTGLSVFSCLCCCWILGIIAIIYSCRTSDAKKNGNYPDAKKYSDIAKHLSITSIVIGVVWITVVIALQFTVLKKNNHNYNYNYGT